MVESLIARERMNADNWREYVEFELPESVQEMLKDLKAGALQVPRGVSLSRVKKEVVVLVASTKKIQDEDVLRQYKGKEKAPISTMFSNLISMKLWMVLHGSMHMVMAD